MPGGGRGGLATAAVAAVATCCALAAVFAGPGPAASPVHPAPARSAHPDAVVGPPFAVATSRVPAPRGPAQARRPGAASPAARACAGRPQFDAAVADEIMAGK